MIPEEKIEELVSEVDIVTYIREELGADLNKANKMVCPFHQDSDPSLSVEPNEQFFYCFGCNIGGNVINFHMHYKKESFLEAVRSVADHASYDIGDLFGEEEQRRYNERQVLNEVFLDAAKYLHKQLPSDMRETLKENYGFTDEFIDEMKIGYGDESLYHYLKSLDKYEEKEIMGTGMFTKSRDFFFKTRIIFWYWKRGFPQFGIARMTEHTKGLEGYKEFEKGRKYKKLILSKEYSSEVLEEPIYNATICRNTHDRPSFVVITEGITDAMICQMLDIPVISPVTKQFKDKHLRKLRKITRHIPNIYIINDNDRNEEGFKGALKTAQVLNKEGKQVYITELPDPPEGQKSYDLNDFLREHGKDKFEDYIHQKSKLYLDLLVDKALKYQEEDSLAQMDEMIDKAVYEARNMKEIPKQRFFKDLASKLGVRVKDIREHFKEVIKEKEAKPEHKQTDDYLEELLEKKKEQEASEAQKLFKWFLKKGGAKFYRSGNSIEVTMVFEGKFYKITEEKSEFTMLLMNRFGYNHKDHKVKKLIAEFEAKAYKHATKKKKQTWLYCDKFNRILYLPIGNDTNYIIKITPDKITKVYNGEDEGIFINIPDIMKDWELKKDINQVNVAKKMNKMFTNYMPFSDQDALMLLISAMTTPLKRFADTVVLVKMHGEAGSGKSTACELISNMFYGEVIIGKMTEASKYDQASKRPIIFLDNVEKIKDHELQFLLFSASGGVREKRDRNNETGTILQHIDSMVMVNGIHPFDKTELINRSIDFVAHKKYHTKDKSLVIVNDEIVQNRDEFLSLWVILLQKSLAKKEELNNKRNFLAARPNHFKERLNSYYALVWQMLEEFKVLLGVKRERIKKEMLGWIKEQSEVGEDADKETNKIVHYLNTLVSYIKNDNSFMSLEFNQDPGDERIYPDPKKKEGKAKRVISFELSSRELLNNFDKIAKDLGNRSPFKNAQQLMARLNNSDKVLSKNNWVIDTNAKKVSGTNVHKFVYTEKDDTDESWDDL